MVVPAVDAFTVAMSAKSNFAPPLPALIASPFAAADSPTGINATRRGCWGIKVNVDYLGIFLATNPNPYAHGRGECNHREANGRLTVHDQR
jgi:hypothetical protein